MLTTMMQRFRGKLFVGRRRKALRFYGRSVKNETGDIRKDDAGGCLYTLYCEVYVLPLDLFLVISTAGDFPVFRPELRLTRPVRVLFRKHRWSSQNIKHQILKGLFIADMLGNTSHPEF
jgi:hypothetical protein